MDTSELSGQFHRRVILTSNDPNHPVLGASVRVNVRPAYRILSSQPKVVIIGDQGADLEAYLVIEPGIKITPLSVRLDGLKGKVTYEPWSGNLADPDRKEPARPREGYLFRIHVDPTDFGVSAQIGIAVATDNPKFPVLRRGFGIQRGIAVSPDELYLGEVGAKARPFSFLVSRPGHPFRLLSASSDTPYLKVGKLPTDSKDEFKLSVSYLGHALPGPIRASILLTTDEPTQRTVVLRVSGEAR
ncbi:MAG: hypothetical protein HY248_04465 [Fimbriimonas ginsengisoli]|nr:hypothetical protein [Fimbriimonas ginsengisoli]